MNTITHTGVDATSTNGTHSTGRQGKKITSCDFYAFFCLLRHVLPL